MQFLVGLCLVIACAAYVRSESCTANDDCTATQCASTHHVICEHSQESGVTTNGGLCTCALTAFTCTIKADCSSMSCPANRNYHCYDGNCICSRW